MWGDGVVFRGARTLVGALVLLLALRAAADEKPFEFAIVISSDAPVDGRIPVNVAALRVSDSGRVGQERIVASCTAPGRCALDLHAGTWILELAENPALYAYPSTVTFTPGKEGQATLQVIPKTVLSGTFSGATASEATMQFRPADPNGSAPDGLVRCAIEGERWSCGVPRGQWDLRFRIPGHASHYFTNFVVGAESRSLGHLQMKKGASVAGTVRLARGTALAGGSRITVTLAPAGTADGAKPSFHSAVANEKGFFHFAGVAPGAHTLHARADSLVTETRVIEVLADREARVREPLMLAERSRLSVEVHPPASHGKPWRVELMSAADARRRESLGQQQTVNGTASFRAGPGQYVIRLKDAADAVWEERTVEIAQSALTERFDVAVMRVEGRVRLGKRGIGAQLTIRGADKHSAAKVVTDDDGMFAVELPRVADDARWTVEVKSELLFVTRTLADVPITRDGEGLARMVIDLPPTRLAGRVIGLDQQPVTDGAIVDVSRRDEDDAVAQTALGEDGEFVLNGLAVGEYDVRAITYDKRSSDLVRIVMDAEEPESWLTLVVRPDRDMSGIVSSDSGPVPAATVWIMPTDRAVPFHYPRTTDANGRFAFLLPGGSFECDFHVEAPGFATRLFHRRADANSVAIRVGQLSGTLRLQLPAQQSDPRRPHPWVVHDGAVVHAYSLLQRRVTASSGEAVMEPGVYSLCIAAESELPRIRAGILDARRCVSGMLAPFGELILDGASLGEQRTAAGAAQ